jgi:hypothetical protein
MRQSPVIPIVSFLLAVSIAALSPSSRHLLRAAGETTGCTVTAVISGKDFPDYQKEGKDSVRENGKEGLRKALEQGFKKLKFPTNSDFVKGELDKTVNEAFDNSYDAVTRSFATFGIQSIDKTDNLWTVKATFNEYTVVVLPNKADATLTNHEEGHKSIAEMTVEYAKKKIKAAVEAAGCDEAAIRAAFNAAVANALDVQKAADKDYDDKTEHGEKGGENGQLPAAAAAFAAASGN